LHEVDVLATKPGLITLVECKFRSDYRGKTDVKVSLYIHSRFNDIEAKWRENPEYEHTKIEGFIVTNARFTKDAINYAECAGLGLISWDYPAESSLKYYVDKSGMHPITSLHSLTKAQKSNLLKDGIVLCRELVKSEIALRNLGLSEKQIGKVISEARLLSTQ
jgi:Holliday junction resolvase